MHSLLHCAGVPRFQNPVGPTAPSQRTRRVGSALVHVEEVNHRRLQRSDGRIIEPHADLADGDLERGAVPVLSNLVVLGQPLVGEGAQLFAHFLPAVPVSYAEVAIDLVG